MGKTKTLNNREIAAFCEQMAMILHSGITPRSGLELMLSDSKDQATKDLLQSLVDHTSKGGKFATSVAECGYFPEYVVNMVIIGEDSGKLDEVMQSLSDYYNHEEVVRDNIRSAITYPIIMVCMMVFIIIVLITKVLPLFNQVFIQLGTEMTGLSATLLHLGQSIHTYSIVLIGIFAILIIAALYLLRTTGGQRITRRMKERLPIVKDFYKNIAYGRFATGMAITLSSGLGVYKSLNMVRKIVEHNEIEAQIDACEKTMVDNSDTLAEALLNVGILGNLYGRMVSIGEKSGNTYEILGKIGRLYEEETERHLQTFISIIEPTLVIVLSLIVGLILLSVILPLLGVMSSLG